MASRYCSQKYGKQYNELLRKAHWNKGYEIWRSAIGPLELAQVTMSTKWADLDAGFATDPAMKEYQTDRTRIVARINESFSASRRTIELVNPEATISGTEIPKMIQVWTAHVKMGKMSEATELELKEYLPALKAGGVKTYNFATVRMGAPANEIHAVVGIDNWAAFDDVNPVHKAMGEEKYRAFSAKMNALLDDYHYDIYRYDAELSYIPAK